MNALSQAMLHPAFQSFFIMVLVIVIERNWPIANRYHPLTVFRLLAQQMALKVNPDPDRSKQQKLISGTLAMIVLLVPLLLPLGLFIQLADIPQFFDGLLLLIALQFQGTLIQAKRIAISLNQEKKSLARHFLSDLCLRQTDRLSEVGLCKATIESTLLRFTYQYIAVLFWFLCAGGLGALTYRLIFELSHGWHTRLKKNQHFGQPAAMLRRVLAWLPAQLTSLTFMLAQDITHAIQSKKRLPARTSPRDKLIAVYAGALCCQLGGPAIYEQVKYRLLKSGPARLPQSQDILTCLAAINKALVIWITLNLLMSACFYAINPGL